MKKLSKSLVISIIGVSLFTVVTSIATSRIPKDVFDIDMYKDRTKMSYKDRFNVFNTPSKNEEYPTDIRVK